jgi:ribonuclease HI
MKGCFYTDGGARGNPGPAGIGVVIKDSNGKVIRDFSGFIGRATNNEAEYQSLIKGLELALDCGLNDCKAWMDSELVVKQINGEYRVKKKELKILWLQARSLIGEFEKFELSHIKRENNQEADALVNQAIDASVM